MALFHPSGTATTDGSAVALPVARSTAVLWPSPVRRTATEAVVLIPLLNGTGRATPSLVAPNSKRTAVSVAVRMVVVRASTCSVFGSAATRSSRRSAAPCIGASP